jgi:hypothetical protein
MGHQLNFYALPAGIAQLERVLRETEDIAILHSRSESVELRIVDSLDVHEHDTQWLFFFLVRRADLADVVTRHVPAQGYWAIDDTRSPVIELTRCFFDDTVLRRGRLWYADGFYGIDRAWVEKPKEFRDWGQKVLLRARRTLMPWKSDYISAEVKDWLETGGRLAAL